MSEDRNESRQAEIMSKQDLQGVRTPADVERKYNFGKKFSEVYEIADGARETAEAAKKIAEEAGGNLTQEEIFNILTDNGTWQGIYRDDNGNVYINASYLKAGTYTSTKEVFVEPGREEAIMIMRHLNDSIVIPDELIPFYDFDGNGTLTMTDALLAMQAEEGMISLANWSGAKKTPVTVTIDPSSPDSAIRITGSDMWGRTFDKKLGLKSAFLSSTNDGCLYNKTDAGEQEWITPPMEEGLEYRTAFKHNGNPVYATLDATTGNISCRLSGGETYTEVLHLEYGDFSEWDEENYINYTPTFYLSHKIESIESCSWENSENYDYILDATWYVSDDGGIYFKGYFDDYVGNGVDVTVTYKSRAVRKNLFADTPEEGTVDGWTYIKHPSGICECWKTFTNVAFETKVAWGNGYLSSQNGSTHQHWFSLPSGLLTSGDVAHIDLGTPGFVMMACFTNVSAAGVTCYIWSPTSYDGSTPIGKVCISVKGRWK